MKQKIVAPLTSATASPSIAIAESGFLTGMQVVADVFAPTGAFAGTAQWQVSEDNTNWTNVGTSVVLTTGGFNTQTIPLKQFARLNVSAFTSGSVAGRLLSDIA